LILDKEIYNKLIQDEHDGIRIPRNKKIWHQNITNVKRANIKYAMNAEELSEYVKCSNDIIYFSEKYCKIQTSSTNQINQISQIKLRNYQIDILNMFQTYKYNIWFSSRQIGSTQIIAIISLHQMLFNKNKHIIYFSNKKCMGAEIINKIQQIYKHLNFFLKCGVISWNNKNIIFDNGSKITTSSSFNKEDKTIDIFIIDHLGHIHNTEQLYKDIIPNVTESTA
jgi:hypothetical protein